MIIDSQMIVLKSKMPLYEDLTIKNEPMLFNCDFRHAEKHGRQITHKFLDLLPEEFTQGPVVIDTRVHMLMPSWYPCIPGWHHDDVPRSLPNNQPNYNDTLRSKHCMALVNPAASATEFAIGEASFPEPTPTNVYKPWHNHIDKLITEQKLILHRVKDQNLIVFNDRTWHQGTPAVQFGWRWFGRASIYTRDGVRVERPNARTNEVRKQVQVYIPHNMLNNGW